MGDVNKFMRQMLGVPNIKPVTTDLYKEINILLDIINVQDAKSFSSRLKLDDAVKDSSAQSQQ